MLLGFAVCSSLQQRDVIRTVMGILMILITIVLFKCING